MEKFLLPFSLLLMTWAYAGPPSPFIFGGDAKSVNIQTGIALPQATTPAAPVTGRDYLYFKSDDNLYMKNHAGTETQITGGASGSGNVVGPASSTNNALAVYGDTTGKLLINSSPTVSGSTITASLTGAASLNVLKAGDTMTGPLVMPSGVPSATPVNFGTSGTGLYGTGTSVSVSVSGVKEATFSANTSNFYNSAGGGLQIDNTSTSNIFLERNGSNPFAQISNKSTGGAGLDWLCFGANNGCSSVTSPWPFMIRTAPADGSITALTSFVALDGNSVNGLPIDIMVNGSSTTNTLACRATGGSSFAPMGAACSRHITQTSAAEVSEYLLANMDSGILTEHFRIKTHGLIETGGVLPTVTCNGSAATVETGSSGTNARFTIPAIPGTSCTVTLPDTADSKPICNAVDEGISALEVMVCTSTTSCTITDAGMVATNKIAFHCEAHF